MPKIDAALKAILPLLLLAGCATPPRPAAPQLMVYEGGGCWGRDQLRKFNRFLGRDADGVIEFMSIKSWPDLHNALDWGLDCWKGQPYQMAISMPMLVANGDFSAGSRGAYDREFSRVAAALVRHGRGDSYVRIGWEFNGDWYNWTAAGRPEEWKSYFRRIALIFRHTPGAKFKIVWNTGLGKHAIAPDLAYPGDDVVDVIAADVYNFRTHPVDQAEMRWLKYRVQPYGLDWLARFAALHHKPIAIPEWGTGTNKEGTAAGDDPRFIEGMAEWIRNNDVIFHGYWDYPAPDYNALLSTGRLPLSAEAFRTAFGPPQPVPAAADVARLSGSKIK